MPGLRLTDIHTAQRVRRLTVAPFLMKAEAIWEHMNVVLLLEFKCVLTIFPIPREPPVIRTTLPATENNDSACRELMIDSN